ncbi:MAG: pilus assembly protein PilM [Clostridia bacterium]|nr:pilus assembly protein PilM [Clostridia bacterium]
MAKKTILGVDIGHDQLKLALVRGRRVLKTATAEMPENLLKEGRVVSREVMGELVRSTMKSNGIHAKHAAFVLPDNVVFIKNVEMPAMSAEQLEYNLPFEFNDYITGELKDFVFDYAVLPKENPEEDAGEEQEQPSDQDETVSLMAVGVSRAVVEDAQVLLHKAGLKMVMCAPSVSAYIALIRAQRENLSQVGEEFGILDLGSRSIRMYMFRGDRHIATRELEVGLSRLDDVLAEAFGVDPHLAHTYLMSNYQDCQQREECRIAYENIAVELVRALNFYRFSNRDSTLSDMWLCGGGAVIEPLADAIGSMVDMRLHTPDELVPGGEAVPDCNSYIQAIGIAMA